MKPQSLLLWIGLALLSASWVTGYGLFWPVGPVAWTALTVAGVGLVCWGFAAANHEIRVGVNTAHPAWSWVAAALLLPAVWLTPWPFNVGPLLIAAALLVGLGRGALAVRLSAGLMVAGLAILAQGIAISSYVVLTARWHDLPWPFAAALAGVARLFGNEAAAVDSTVVLSTLRQAHRLAVTWELLLDPVSLAYFAGAAVVLTVSCGPWTEPAAAARRWWPRLGTLAIIALGWLPLRAVLLTALFVQRVAMTDPQIALDAMSHFYSTWTFLAMVAGPVLLCWWWIGDCKLQIANCKLQIEDRTRDITAVPDLQDFQSPIPKPQSLRLGAAAAIALLAGVCLALGYAWQPIGPRKGCRVAVMERHSNWSSTIRPYDRTWYVEPKLFTEGSGYNYGLAYTHLGRHYEMSRIMPGDKIDEERLSRCDVLIIKIPTERYAPAEVRAVQEFVARGGGLLLIGDHTNYERSSTAMNDITRAMGFIFRDDLLFGMESPYRERYVPPPAAHPAVQALPPMEFAVSCSIDPGRSLGQSALIGTRLWSMGPAYEFSNFHPVPAQGAEMRYGAFAQIWAAQYGRGRVLAFTDSTILSNFCLFQPGHWELMLGMVEWLNRDNAVPAWYWLAPLGLVLLGGAVWLMHRAGGVWLLAVAAVVCGWSVGIAAAGAINRHAMPLPEARDPPLRVVIDREVSEAPLAHCLYPEGEDRGYGMAEAWIPRLGYLTTRRSGEEVFGGDFLVIFAPTKPVSEDYRRRLVEFVEGGGRVLVIDSAANAKSTAGGLLRPFGLELKREPALKGTLTLTDSAVTLPADQAIEVTGGEPAAMVDKQVVAAVARRGRGRVMAVGCGQLFTDSFMGHWGDEPPTEVRRRYDAFYALVQMAAEGRTTPISGEVPEPQDELR